MKPYKAIIFDLDGVIVNSEPLHKKAFEEIFQELGYSPNETMDFEAYLGRSDRVFWVDFVAQYQPMQTLDELIQLKQQRFMELIRRYQPIFPQVPRLVEHLSAHYALALASGSLHVVIEEILAIRNLRRFFPVVASIQDVPRGKPWPDVFLRTSELLKVPPKECCVIEDAAAGVEAALAAGMAVIAITNSLAASQLSRATHVVDSYDAIEELLLDPAPRRVI